MLRIFRMALCVAGFVCDMPCYHPIRGYRAIDGLTSNRKRPIVFNIKEGSVDREVSIPCGECEGCIAARAWQWTMRCMHEAKMFDVSSFVTLTYEVEPGDGSVCKRDLQLFFKRLRKSGEFRYFAVGEYGELRGRPHYHALLFGRSFSDRVHLRSSPGGEVYSSDILSRAWGKGLCEVGDVSIASIKYVTGYILKPGVKRWSDGRAKPFQVMSRRPGLGYNYFVKYGSDIWPRDEVVIDGHLVTPPKYYDSLQEKVDRGVVLRAKEARSDAVSKSPDLNGSRLYTLWESKRLKNAHFARNRLLEKGA